MKKLDDTPSFIPSNLFYPPVPLSDTLHKSFPKIFPNLCQSAIILKREVGFFFPTWNFFIE